MNGSGEKRAINGGAGLKSKGEDKGVERESGVNVVEERKGLVVTSIVDVRC